jgi:acetyl/propionyl-CoA carboxylase alpha subunit
LKNSAAGIAAVDNYIYNCGIGVSVGPAYDGSIGSQEAAHTHVKNNVIVNSWQCGVFAAARPGTVNRDLQVTGNTIYKAEVLEALARPDEGKELNLEQLKAVAARVTEYYRERGYILAYAYLPPQDVREGVIEIAILEAMKMEMPLVAPISGVIKEIRVSAGQEVEAEATIAMIE